MRRIGSRPSGRALALLLGGALCAGFCGTIAAPTAAAAQAPIIQYFQNPDVSSKPMARMWFPDAGAGADSQDYITTQIQALADAGFGGVEVAMLRDGSDLSNQDARTYGWGTQNWINLLKKVLRAAAAIPGGFQVDMTITAHWPPTLNTIDPNDAAASQETSYSFTALTASDLANGAVTLALPTTKTSIAASAGPGGPAGADTPFIFTDSFVSAAVAQVVGVTTIPGSPATPFSPATPDTYAPELALASLTPTGTVSSFGGHSAGIPDAAACATYGFADVSACLAAAADKFGPVPTGSLDYTNGQLVATGTGKQDADRDRKRMADWQYDYSADLSAFSSLDLSGQGTGALVPGTNLHVGDYIVVSTFVRGTGQDVGGGAHIMANGAFVTNYFNQAGTNIVLDYWNAMLAQDPELKSLMQNAAVKGNIFEDSIEATNSTSYWTSTALADMTLPASYAYTDILPIVAASRHRGSGGFGSSPNADYYTFDDSSLADLIYEDYNTQMGMLYANDRVTGVSNWAHNSVGWGFRGQTYQLPGSEIANAASVADVPETDNMAKGDGVRYQAGTVNVTGKNYLTMEAMTGLTIGLASMGDILTEAGQNYSDGVSRLILHGTPYAKTYDGYNSDWPGWLPFGAGSFGDAYTYREPYWSDISTETAYMARIQSIIQKGTAKIDVAVMQDVLNTFDFVNQNAFQELLDAGYSYNLLSQATLTAATATCSGGVMDASGPAFKAIVTDEVSVISVASAQKLLTCAQAGVPVILYNSGLSRVYGSSTADNAALATVVAQLKSTPGVQSVSSTADVLAALKTLGVTPWASYSQSQLETTRYTDSTDGTSYYYMYNNANPTNNGMMGNGVGKTYKTDSNVISNVTVTLKGSGVPYRLDPHTGEISQVGQYTVNNDGTVSFVIDRLAGGDAVIYALTTNTADFPAPALHVTSTTPPGATIVRTANGDLALRSNSAGTYTVTTSTPEALTVTVANTLSVLDLSAQKWHLVIDSYGPVVKNSSTVYSTSGAAAWSGLDPSQSKITTVDFGQQDLVNWEDIPATSAQLAALGVPDMMYVSGVGHYSTTFTTPANWDATTGAYLDLTYGWDQIGSITVNGTVFTANNATDRVDIGAALVPGQNAIEIKLASTLFGRMYLENAGYDDKNGTVEPVVTGMFGGGSPQEYSDGLLTATLTPYSQVALGNPGPTQGPTSGPANTTKPGSTVKAPTGGAIVADPAGTVPALLGLLVMAAVGAISVGLRVRARATTH